MSTTLALAVAACALVEGAARLIERRSGPPEPDAASPGETSPEAGIRSVHSLHPYFGFTMRPGRTPADSVPQRDLRAMCSRFPVAWADQPTARWLDLPANALGMWSEHPFPYHPADGEIAIGVFGGSVANWFALQGAEPLAERFAGIPELAGARPVLLNFAIPGGKQPQQLAVLNYVLSRGQRLDLVLNIDGINELLWARYNHEVQQVDFSLPSTHLLGPLKHLTHGGEAGVEGLFALVDSLRARLAAERVATWRAGSRSAALRILLAAVERRFRELSTRRLVRAAGTKTDPKGDPLPFAPQVPLDDEGALGRYWRDCSLQAHRICMAHRILYVHVLQPTPYTSGRVPTEAERAFLEPEGASAKLVLRQYPRLHELGAELREAGVPFLSADAAFARITQTLFSDHWGHLNQLGNEVLAELVGMQIEGLVREPATAASA